jgi:hypothetical protein
MKITENVHSEPLYVLNRANFGQPNKFVFTGLTARHNRFGGNSSPPDPIRD